MKWNGEIDCYQIIKGFEYLAMEFGLYPLNIRRKKILNQSVLVRFIFRMIILKELWVMTYIGARQIA